jgi:hypothetical protein
METALFQDGGQIKREKYIYHQSITMVPSIFQSFATFPTHLVFHYLLHGGGGGGGTLKQGGATLTGDRGTYVNRRACSLTTQIIVFKYERCYLTQGMPDLK